MNVKKDESIHSLAQNRLGFYQIDQSWSIDTNFLRPENFQFQPYRKVQVDGQGQTNTKGLA